MKNSFVSPWLSRLFILCCTVLAISGLAQMPIFKRYYIADLPGLGWLADFYFTHKLHYLFAAILLGLLGQVLALWGTRWHRFVRVSTSGRVRIVLLGGLVLTGVLRMAKNQQGISFSPMFTMLVDWTHLGLALMLGVVAAIAYGMGKSGYFIVKK